MQVRPRGAGGEVLGPFQPFQTLGERTFSTTLASLSIYYSHFTDEKRKAVGTHTQASWLLVPTAVLYAFTDLAMNWLILLFSQICIWV